MGWAGFQKQLGALHLEIMTEALRHQWLPVTEDDDGRRLPEPPFVRGDHNAWALARARTLARELVELNRRVGDYLMTEMNQMLDVRRMGRCGATQSLGVVEERSLGRKRSRTSRL